MWYIFATTMKRLTGIFFLMKEMHTLVQLTSKDAYNLLDEEVYGKDVYGKDECMMKKKIVLMTAFLEDEDLRPIEEDFRHLPATLSPTEYCMRSFDPTQKAEIVFQTNVYAIQNGKRFEPTNEMEN